MSKALTGISNVLAHGAASGGASTHVFDGHNIRVIEIDGAPWFVAVDVGRAIGLSNPKGHYHIVNADEKRMVNRIALALAPGRDMMVLSESGLYKLIMRSDKPEARAAGQPVGDIVAGIKGGDLHRVKTYPVEWAKRWLRENYKAIFGDPADRPGTPEHTAMLRRRLGLSLTPRNQQVTGTSQ